MNFLSLGYELRPIDASRSRQTGEILAWASTRQIRQVSVLLGTHWNPPTVAWPSSVMETRRT